MWLRHRHIDTLQTKYFLVSISNDKTLWVNQKNSWDIVSCFIRHFFLLVFITTTWLCYINTVVFIMWRKFAYERKARICSTTRLQGISRDLEVFRKHSGVMYHTEIPPVASTDTFEPWFVEQFWDKFAKNCK